MKYVDKVNNIIRSMYSFALLIINEHWTQLERKRERQTDRVREGDRAPSRNELRKKC